MRNGERVNGEDWDFKSMNGGLDSSAKAWFAVGGGKPGTWSVELLTGISYDRHTTTS